VRINAGTGAIMPYTATVRVRGSNGILAEFNVSFTVNKLTGAAVGVPELLEAKANEITVSPVQLSGPNPGSQSVEYAISTLLSPALSTLQWQIDTKFEGLMPLTTYYVFARTAGNNNCNAGAVQCSLPITTSEEP